MNWKMTGPGLSIVLALLAMRLVIGMHFFAEGTGKLNSGKFNAAGFLSTAKGPLANWFGTFLDDPDGSELLCVATKPSGAARSADDVPDVKLDPNRTIAVWGDFADRCASHFHFADLELVKRLQTERSDLAKQIQKARQDKDNKVDTAALELRRKTSEVEIKAIRNQLVRLKDIVEVHVDELTQWLNSNRIELIEHYATAHRTSGFERDGPASAVAAQQVESLRLQTDKIVAERKKKLSGWSREVSQIWDSLELSVNELATESQKAGTIVRIHRPHDQPASTIKWINRIVPAFDLAVGIMLALGLFPRLAAAAGALFLASILATQPPWIPGAAETWSQSIEMLALLVLATGIGNLIPGLGWLFRRKWTGPEPQRPTAA